MVEASGKQAEWEGGRREGNEGGVRDELVTGRRESEREERRRRVGGAFLGDSAWRREGRRVDGQRVGWMDGGVRERGEGGDGAPL